MFISEKDFAQTIIDYITKNEEQLSNAREKNGNEVPADHWVFQGSDINNQLYHVPIFFHYFDKVGSLKPRCWNDFQRQYYTAEYQLIRLLWDESLNPRLASWRLNGSKTRQSFYMNRHYNFAPEICQRNFDDLLAELEKSYDISRKRSTRSRYTVRNLEIGSLTLQIPGDFATLRQFLINPESTEIPNIPPFSESVYPYIFIIGNTLTKKEALDYMGQREDVYDILNGDGFCKAKQQQLMFVLAEVNNAKYWPRLIGYMNAAVLQDYCGAVLDEFEFVVESEDMTEGERYSLENNDNWRSWQHRYVHNHPQLELIEKFKT